MAAGKYTSGAPLPAEFAAPAPTSLDDTVVKVDTEEFSRQEEQREIVERAWREQEEYVRGVAELKENGAKVDVWDPWVSAREAQAEYGIRLVKKPARGSYDAIVLAVGHREFAAMRPADIRRLAKRKNVLYDIKYLFERGQADGRL